MATALEADKGADGVYLEDLAPLRRIALDDRHAHGPPNTGTVDEDVYLAELVDGGLDRTIHPIGVFHARHDRERFPANGLYFGDHFFESLPVLVSRPHALRCGKFCR